MRIRRFQAIHHPVSLSRTPEGVPRVTAASWDDAYYALGRLHGRDRGGQLGMMRIAAQGRICELLRDDARLLEADRHFRRLGLAHDARHTIAGLDPACHGRLQAYCHGVNAAWNERRPWALRLAGYTPEPFAPHDSLTILKLMAYSGLAEAQRLVELFVVHAVRRGADATQLGELFPALDSLDTAAIRNLVEVPPLFPSGRDPDKIPRGAGSNNWVISGRCSASGAPMLCGDPHLETQRLPAVVYEAHLAVGEDWTHGATIPGLPGFLVGRSRRIAWGLTYSFADTSDHFIERCRAGHYWREGEWLPFRTRNERILRKAHPPEDIVIHTGRHGIVEGEPTRAGDYLSWHWCGMGPGGLGTLQALLELPHCRSARQAQDTVRQADFPALHMLFADADGDIAYQMVGCIPRRRAGWSGLAPVAGWRSENDWCGRLDPITELPALLNPEQGFIVTANEARQLPDGPVLSTVAQPRYRRDRIEALLASHSTASLADMQALQYDVLSLQAQRLLPVFLPHLPPGLERELLRQWDFRYGVESRAATLFDNIYRAAIVEVFGGVLGRDWMETLLDQTHIDVLIFGYLDDVLCREHSSWLPAAQRARVLERAVRAGLERGIEAWGSHNAITLRNMFLGGRLPRLLKFDRGPLPLRGCRATPHQGTKTKHAGVATAFAPCYHFVTDLGAEESWTNLPGGASESRLSRWYANDLERWLRGEYKKI
jgi:penicillin amidase